MQARYPGRCRCGASFKPAAPGLPVEIVFDAKATPKVQGCPACNADCAAKSKPTAAAAVAVAVAVGAVALVPPGAKPVPADGLPAPLPLDPHQSKAAAWSSGWAVVAAGAGSGKTTTLVARILALLRLGSLPEAILTLVFNASAAVTGRERLAKLLGEAVANRCRFMTFHAWGRAVLRAWGDPRAERIVGSDDGPPVKPYAQAAAKAAGVREEWGALVDLSGYIREAMVDLAADDAPDRVADLTGIGLRAAETAVKFAREYQRAKRDGCPGGPKGVLDFSDMLCEVAREIREGTPRAKALCAAYTHVQVDEGQDGNAVRQFLGRALGGGAKSLITVGDLRQSIYAFTGARPDLFQTLAGESTLLVMPVNYRSGKAIVALGNAVARGRAWNLGGDCEARPGAPEGKVARVACPSGDEAGWVATDIAARLATPPGVAPVALTDIAVLARTNAALATAEAALHRRGIPARTGRKGGIWASSVGRAVLAYLRCAEGKPEADAKLISNRPCRYAVGTAVAEAVAKGGDLRDALLASGDRGCERFARALRSLSRMDWAARCAEVGEFLLADLEERAADAAAAADAALAPDDDRAALIKALCKVAAEAGDLAKLDAAVAEAANLPKDAPAVSLVTVHRAKGSEWRHVYILGADAGLFPHANAASGEEQEEERRLLYVAVTRAVDTLTVVHGPTPSPFLDGLPFPGEPTPPTGGGEPKYEPEAPPTVEPVRFASPEREAEVRRLVTGEDAERAEREAAEAAADADEFTLEKWGNGTTPSKAPNCTDEVARDPAPSLPPEATLAAPAAKEPAPILAAIEAAQPAAEAAGAAEPKAADGSRYVPVALASFTALLAPLGGARASSEIEAKMRQVVYTLPLPDGCQIRVYTTIPADGAEDARGVGEDSIKVALLAPDGTGGYTPLMGRLPYACRTRGWRTTLLGKIKLAVREWMAAPRCPRCDAPMARRKGPRGDFYGCTRYARGAGCRETRPVPESTPESK